MSKNPNAASTAFAIILFASGLAPARADERMNQVQTALASTTISGYLSVELTALQPQQISEKSGGLSLSPLPINPSGVEITPEAINLWDVSLEPPVNLSSATIQLGQVNFITGVTYGGDSSGAEMIEASRPTTGILQYPSMPPQPDSQIQFPQASGIQPAPEPSTFALGSLAIGLIALARLSRRQQIVKR